MPDLLLGSSVSEREHPFVAMAAARLELALRAAREVPFPYAPGTPVILATPLRTRFEGRVVSCDPAKWLVIEAIDPPDDWPEPVMHFYPHTVPEAIHNGYIEMATDLRSDPEPIVIPEPPEPNRA